MKKFGKELTKLQETAVKLIEKQGLRVTRISDEDVITCEWCDKTSKAVHVEFIGDLPHMQSTVFENKNFHSQSDWFVCGTCSNS